MTATPMTADARYRAFVEDINRTTDTEIDRSAMRQWCGHRGRASWGLSTCWRCRPTPTGRAEP